MRALPAALVCAIAVTAAAQSRDGAPARPLVRREATVVRDVPAGYGHGLTLAAGPLGNVRVAAWRERSIRIEARLEWFAPSEAELDTLGGVLEAYIEPGPTLLDVSTKGPHDKKWMKGVKDFPKALTAMPWRVDYTVHVPEHTAVTLIVGEGETVVEGVAGIIAVTSARGPVRLASVSGPTSVSASGGPIEISTSERSWRGGNLTATASGAVVFRIPRTFSADLEAKAAGGVMIGGEVVGPVFNGRLGVGGGGINLVSGATIEIVPN